MYMLLVMIVISICVFWKLIKNYQNKDSKIYGWKVAIHDTCLNETIYHENQINLHTLQSCWLDLLIATFNPLKRKGTFYWDIMRVNRYTVFKRYECEVKIVQGNNILLILTEKLEISNVKWNRLTREQSIELESFRYQFLNINLKLKDFYELTIDECCW